MTLQLIRRSSPMPAAALIDKFGQTLARVLAARGVRAVDELSIAVEHLLAADELLGIEQAVVRIDCAIDAQERILVVGDFDCDGATSTALMIRVLRELGAAVDFLIPDRFVFGYGLTAPLVDSAWQQFCPGLIITVDNGISSYAGVERATELGMDVVITDHHLTTAAAPAAYAVVNPNQVGCNFASKALVGVGVAFYVLGKLAKKRRLASKSTTSVSRYLDLVALGTWADVGIMDKNNRILVAQGLKLIRQGQCCMGILAILNKAGKDFTKIRPDDFGFVIAPRINAAGRMDNMRIGVACLLSDDWYEAQELASQLDRLNQERRQTESTMRTAAENMLQAWQAKDAPSFARRALILYDDSWHQGVIGIVAGRLKEQHYLPTLVFAPADAAQIGDEALIKASARSILGVHIHDVIAEVDRQNPGLICHFGGHAMAAGLTLHKKNFERFCAAVYQVMDNFPDHVFCQIHLSDGVLEAGDMNLNFAKKITTLGVWGNGFGEPLFDGVFGVQKAQILKEKHLKLSLLHPDVDYPIDAVWFNFDAEAWDYRAESVHILYKVAVNEWQGNQRLQFFVQALSVLAPPVGLHVAQA